MKEFPEGWNNYNSSKVHSRGPYILHYDNKIMFLQDCIIHCFSQPVFHVRVSIYFQSPPSLDLNNKHVEMLALHQFTQLASIHPPLYSKLMALLIFEFSLITETRVNEREIPRGDITFRFILLKGDTDTESTSKFPVL